MAKWKLPEGRKPLTTVESADLVLRMHDKLAAGFTAGNRIEELEAKLAKLSRAAKPFAAIKIKDGRSQAGEIGRTDVTNLRAALAELRGETDE